MMMWGWKDRTMPTPMAARLCRGLRHCTTPAQKSVTLLKRCCILVIRRQLALALDSWNWCLQAACQLLRQPAQSWE